MRQRSDGNLFESASVPQPEFSDGRLNHRHSGLLDRWLKTLMREQLKCKWIELNAPVAKAHEQVGLAYAADAQGAIRPNHRRWHRKARGVLPGVLALALRSSVGLGGATRSRLLGEEEGNATGKPQSPEDGPQARAVGEVGADVADS